MTLESSVHFRELDSPGDPPALDSFETTFQRSEIANVQNTADILAVQRQSFQTASSSSELARSRCRVWRQAFFFFFSFLKIFASESGCDCNYLCAGIFGKQFVSSTLTSTIFWC